MGLLGPLMVFARTNFMRKTGRLLIVNNFANNYAIQVVAYIPGMQKLTLFVGAFSRRKVVGHACEKCRNISQQSL
jgi:hypothetical protein